MISIPAFGKDLHYWFHNFLMSNNLYMRTFNRINIELSSYNAKIILIDSSLKYSIQFEDEENMIKFLLEWS